MSTDNRKLLFFDIDGTLLAGGMGGYVPDSAIKALKQAQEKGHLIFVNSGRSQAILPQIIRDFPFDGFVCGCGTDISLHGETIFRKKHPEEFLRELPSIARRCNMQIVAEGHQYCYYDEETTYGQDAKDLMALYDSLNPYDSILPFSSERLDFSKFLVIFNEDANIPLFKDLVKEHFYYIEREGFEHDMFAEIVGNGCTKATGIDFLVDYFNLNLEDCYVFGDNSNDLPMLTHVKHSIAMGNSFPGIFDKTEYVTTDIDDDGIYNAMKHYQLI